MGRHRKSRNVGLPPHLYEVGNGYYAYRHPQTHKMHGMGKSRSAAINATKQLNSILSASSTLAGRVLGDSERSFSVFLDWFESETLPTLQISVETSRGYRLRLRHVRSGLGQLDTASITVADVAQFLDAYPSTQSNRYRALLAVLFKYAISRGLRDTNPAATTIKRPEKVKRSRLTLDQFHAIRQHAPAWLQNAMDLGLLTLQRREDLTSLRWEDLHDGALWVRQKKVQRWGGGNLKIGLTADIEAVLERCRDSLPSAYIIHRKPTRRVKVEGRGDLYAVLPDLVTKTFAEARAACGLFQDSQDPRTLPSFHEIRSLGAALYEQAGRSPELVQLLLGHTSQAMTLHYLAGHGVRWADVQL